MQHAPGNPKKVFRSVCKSQNVCPNVIKTYLHTYLWNNSDSSDSHDSCDSCDSSDSSDNSDSSDSSDSSYQTTLWLTFCD